MSLLDWSQCPAVESVPGKVSGAWVFKNTRMPVSAVFDVTPEQVKAVIECASRSLEAPVLVR